MARTLLLLIAGTTWFSDHGIKKTNDLLSFRESGLNHPFSVKGSSVAALDPFFYPYSSPTAPSLKKCSALTVLTLYYPSLRIRAWKQHRSAPLHK